MRIAIFGGTFDPPHVGHLLAASDAFEQLSLDRLVFVPAARQPLKAAGPAAPPEARLAMLLSMIAGDPRFAVDAIEIRRGGLSYTVETLETYRSRHGGAELFLCLGADAVWSFPRWREPRRIMALARVAVLARVDDRGSLPDAAVLMDVLRGAGGPGALEPVVLNTRRVDLSSTEIRARIKGGKPVRGFVPESVERYIASSGLYTTREE